MDYTQNNKCQHDISKIFLPVEISQSPTKLKFNGNCHSDENRWEVFNLAKLGSLVWTLLSIVLILYSLFHFLYDVVLSNFYKIPLLGSCIVFIVCLFFYFFLPKKELILNRKDGTITFSRLLWNKNETIPFNKLKFCISKEGDNVNGTGRLELIKPKTLSQKHPIAFCGTYAEDLSLISWYMDKNRPLPPGTAFDEYRDVDFERRKSEGFPPPLYKSRILTPETTPEQQIERETYWKDEDYMVP